MTVSQTKAQQLKLPVQHAHSYRSTDCNNKLASVIFPDSDIAKKMSCGRTKSACIVTQVLAPVSVEKYIRDLTSPILPGDKHKHTPFFSVASDASNHGSVKLFPLALRYWTPELGLQTNVLDFYEDSDEASEINPQSNTKLTKR